MARTAPPAIDVPHPHVSAAQRLVDVMLFFCATPIAIWLLVSFLLPLGFGIAHRADAYVTWLRRVQEADRVQAQRLTPQLGVGERVWVDEAWTYRRASNAVRAVVPQDEEAFFSSRVDDGSSAARMTGALARQANAWIADRFWPVQTAWWTTFLTRGWYALQLALLWLPAAFAAYWWGEHRARLLSRDGIQPMGHRFLLWMQVLKYACASIPLLMALPAPLPTVPALAALYLIALIAVARARAQFIEV